MLRSGKQFIGFDFDSIRETNWWVVALAVMVDATILAVSMLVVLPFLKSSFPVEHFTNGLIQATLIFSVVRFVLVAVGVMMLLGGLRARDIGLRWEKLPSGVLTVGAVWAMMQLIAMAISLVVSGNMALSPIWTLDRIPFIAGDLIAQFLGNTFAEEVIFRGFLLTQVYLLLKAKISGRSWLLMASLLVSQLIFSLSHIPQRLVGDYSLSGLMLNLLLVWISGILFAVLYLRTQNLFTTMGVHALMNAPVMVVDLPSQAIGELLALALGLVLIVAWGPLMRWKENLGTTQIPEHRNLGRQVGHVQPGSATETD